MFIAGAVCGYCGITGAYVELVPYACIQCASVNWPEGYPTKDPSLRTPPNYDGGDDQFDDEDVHVVVDIRSDDVAVQ